MKQRLTLYPSTFLWVKNDRGLIYDSQEGAILEFVLEGEINSICKQLLKLENLYTTELPPLSKQSETWLNNIIRLKMGFTDSVKDVRPVSLPPMLNLQCDYERRKDDGYFSKGKDILGYFHKLNIYVGGAVEKKAYYKQILYPFDSPNLMEIKQIKRLIADSAIDTVSEINVLLGKYINTTYLNELTEALEHIKDKVCFYIIPEPDSAYLFKILDKNGYKTTIIFSSDDGLDIAKFDGKRTYNFIIRNEKEYQRYEEIIAENTIDNYSLIPIFENNLKFFEDNIFLNKEDLFSIIINKREIFAHMAININHFGTLNVLPDGSVYSNVNSPSLSSTNESIKELIFKEMEQNHAWRVIRNNKICSECLFQWLCPSPSNYEIVMQRDVVCTI